MIKDFIVQNWYYIALIFIAICNMILLICKKNKVVQEDTLFTKLLEILPVMIRRAEDTGLDGVNKLTFVIDTAMSWLADYTGKNTACIRATYQERVITAVENILSTPEKKGDK